MLIRVSGKLSDGKSFSSRVNGDSAADAVAKVAGQIKSKVPGAVVSEIHGKPMGEASEVYIGEVNARKPKAAAAKK